VLRPRQYDVFFNVGSSDNASDSGAPVMVSGLVSAELHGASLYMLTVLDLGSRGLRVESLRQVASGLRNAAGIALEPPGDLLFEDNGIDDPVFGDEPFSADELNRLSRRQVRSAEVERFGFPDGYVQYRTGTVVGGGIQPLVAFQPAPPDASESEGAAEITLAPSRFPPGLNQGVFVGFHGKFDDAGLVNEENPVVYADLGTGQYFHFIGNDEPFVGHLDALLATADSLFLADLSSQGSVGPDGAGSGVIYQIKAVPR
jgi:glucose/arabinose dehydrogenase